MEAACPAPPAKARERESQVKETRTIAVHHVARVEGHGNIRIRIRDGRLREARWEVVETPLYF